MATVRDKFRGLLQHPYEPLFLPKNQGQLFYDLPENFFTERYRPIGQNLINRFGASAIPPQGASADTPVMNRVSINSIQEPDLAFAEAIPRRGAFSLFIPAHRQIAGRLIALFLEQPDADTLGDVAAFARDRLNGPLFQYALSSAVLHRTDTEDVPVPSFLHLFPDRFVDPAIFPQMLEEGRAVLQANRMSVDIPMNYTASERVTEQRLAYFREDIGVNLHHWHWHLVYPGDGPDRVVRKNRRGELFYYMHQQMIARYQVERYSQGLGNVTQLNNLRAPVPEPYYPKILRSANNRTYPARYTNMTMEDVQRADDQLRVIIADVERQLQRIVEAIDAGVVVQPGGQRTQLDNFRGIDILGDIIESSALSVNRDFYGDTHNSGHILLSFIHDPRGEFLESFGVMGDVTTAMRDPIFYRWHTYVNNLFQRHKLRFAPYGPADLSNPGVILNSLETELDRQGSVKNLFLTFWQRSQVDLGAGLDFGPEGNVFVTFTHLQHAPFNFRLQVAYTGQPKPATVRLFLAPKRNERGATLTFEEQRRLAIEMDTFRVNLLPGTNNIIRRSVNSSVTIPYERTFRNVGQSNAGDESFRFCGCGWPSHMLVPKGDAIGVEYDLFAMLSNHERDVVNPLFDEKMGCNDAHSFCGLRDRTYPDARNMGFPLDRRVPNGVQSFKDFIAPYPNMRVATVTVRFTNTVVRKMSDIETGFLCLMTRPTEPLFYPKYNGEIYMDLPSEYLPERYQPIADAIKTQHGSVAKHHITIKPVAELPDFSYTARVPRDGDFNLFNPAQRHTAGRLIADLIAQPDPETMLSVAAYARDRLNPTMFQYALAVALVHRKDTGSVPVPSFLEMFPTRFVDPALFPKLREEGFAVRQGQRVAIEVPHNATASEADPEQQLAYFREDIGVNLHHWHWHLVYPQEGPLEVVGKDRRGELFYYMHRQITARYNVERFCNRMPATKALKNMREPIPEAYFPKLLNSALNRTYPGRAANMVLSHVNRPEDDAVTTILELEASLGKIKEAIRSGFALAEDGTRVPLDATIGIDVLGNLIENSDLSVNVPYYGNYHSLGHVLIGYIHDPDNLYHEGHGVMGEFTTAMRDPTFYRFHHHVDDVFDMHKQKLPAYSEPELSFPGVSIADATVQITSGKAARNRLLTFWQRSQVDLGTGLDFGPHGNVLVTFTHLQHAPFAYQIMVHNETAEQKKGTVRIFLAPIYDAQGEQLLLSEQRRYVVEMDKFVVSLHPGENRIIRHSEQSSVTIPYERTFRRVDASNMPGSESFRFCNCGWPAHMLLPKGHPDGQPFELFIMVSDYKDDAVRQGFNPNENCNDSHSYCGLRDQLYPDRRAMGFPFDRLPSSEDHLMRDFVGRFSNMSRTVAEVLFTNTVISRT
ncbi:phenoloxidase 8-like [Anopheles moucheti]|uniref:phenoloxidase 8-like n=1 Tax=Anopheles moucheti TaxID=186751 RepID=UPI0022F117D2|nr:phenoloxidase 8-like [Anopheles moucheti]